MKTDTKSDGSTVQLLENKSKEYSRQSSLDLVTNNTLLTGLLDPYTLPEPPSKTVCVYISCTATDFLVERHKLLTDAVPEVREYARDTYGLQFHAIDTRWGDDRDWNDWDPDRDLSLREILECKRLTRDGPNFVVLIGQRYGVVPVPVAVPIDHFKAIYMSLSKHRNRYTRDSGLLDVWYQLDTNVVPFVYRLVPAETGYEAERTFYLENMMIFPEKCESAFSWKETRNALERLFKKAVEYCIKDGSLSKEIASWYTSSDLEKEVELGLIRASNPRVNCQVYRRTIVDLRNYVTFPNATRFAELHYNEKDERIELDPARADKLSRLRDQHIPSVVPPEVVFHREFLWRHDRGVDPQYHCDYLEQLRDAFVANMKRQIDAYARAQPTYIMSPLIQEINQHWLVAKDKSCDFIGREDVLNVIRSYVLSNDRHPLVIHGDSGSGKTAIMAKAAAETHTWVDEDTIVIVRFIGSTVSSFDTRQLMFTICQQVFLLIGKNKEDVPNTYKDLQQCFLDLLLTIPEDKSIILYLDSLDMLVSQYSAHYLQWLPRTLNENVKIVLSCLPEVHGILERLRTEVIPVDNNFVELPPLPQEECLLLLRSRLEMENRRLHPEQEEHLSECFEQCSFPLYVLLSLREARQWHSSTDPPELPSTIKDFIDFLFDDLEVKHGKMLVSRAMAYLTASSSGVSDSEMEDLLSLDDLVLDEIICTKGDLPIRRLPCVYWMRIKKEIRDFLVEKEAEGVMVSKWSHRLFVDSTRERYLAHDEQRQNIHSMLADYHLGMWHKKPKPYHYPLTDQGDTGGEMSADRYVVSQPLTFKGPGSGENTMYNRRKYEQVPRHLYLSGRLQELNTFVLFSYKFIYNKTKALSLEHVLADFVLNPGVEATLVEKALRDAQPFMEVNIDCMGPELVGRLLPYYKSHTNIRKLIHDCDTSGAVHCGLLPTFPYHQVPGSPLRYTIDCKEAVNQFCLLGDQSRFLVCKDSKTSGIEAFDLVTGENCGSITASVGTMKISPNGQHLIVAGQSSIKIHQTDNGQFVGQLIPMNHLQKTPQSKYRLDHVAVSDSYIAIIMTDDRSFLCLADVEFCKFTEIIGLDGRTTVCDFTPDGRFLFCNSAEKLMAYDLCTMDTVCTLVLERRPSCLVFTENSQKCFLINKHQNMVHALALKDGNAQFVYQIPLHEYFPNDQVCDVKISSNQCMVIARGGSHIIVYDLTSEKVTCTISRPLDVPTEFKLPRTYYKDIQFTAADFSPDNKFVISCIFRNIYIWNLSTDKLLTALQAPVGIIQNMMIPTDRGQIVTHLEGSKQLHVWSLGEAIGHVGQTDRLTRPVKIIKFNSSDTLAFVGCQDSDEVGVIDMATGMLVDLLTHEGPIHDFTVSSSGDFVFIALRDTKPGVYNKIWDIKGRKVVHEFGSTPAYHVALTSCNTVISVLQDAIRFKEPYKIYQYQLYEAGMYEEFQFEQELPFLVERPFITAEDRYFVALTAHDYDEKHALYVNTTLAILSLKNMTGNFVSYSTDDLRKVVPMRRILNVRPCPGSAYNVIMIYTNEADIKDHGDERLRTGYTYSFGFLLFDVSACIVCQVIDNFVTPKTPLNDLLFNSNATLCLDRGSNLYDMATGYFIKRMLSEDTNARPHVLALNGSVCVYSQDHFIFVMRLSDCKMIGHINIHGQVTCVCMCHDDRTIVIGCEDGAVISYAIVDIDVEDVLDLAKCIKSRILEPVDNNSVRMPFMEPCNVNPLSSRSWDKVDFDNALHAPPYSRPPSAINNGPKDTELLKKVKPVSRPQTAAHTGRPWSDVAIRTNYAQAKTCRLM